MEIAWSVSRWVDLLFLALLTFPLTVFAAGICCLSMEADEGQLRLYEFAQDSAQHHDALLWEVTYVIWGSSTLLLGFVPEAVAGQPFLSLCTSIFAAFLTYKIKAFIESFRRIRNDCYDMCKKIEQDLNFEHKPHFATQSWLKPGEMTRLYLQINNTLTVVWVVVALRCIWLMWRYHYSNGLAFSALLSWMPGGLPLQF